MPSTRVRSISWCTSVTRIWWLRGSCTTPWMRRRDCGEVLSGIVASGARPDALIFTGDLTDQGHPDAYAELKAIVEPVAAEIDAQVVWAMGNHDDRPTFRSLLLGEDATDHPVDNVYDLDGLRVITLDSSVPGHHYGEITDGQLDWLRAELAVPAPDGTILALHHPPVPCIQDLAVLVELRDQSRLADVLRGSDVRAILAGICTIRRRRRSPAFRFPCRRRRVTPRT